MKPILPSLRQKKRYLVFEIIANKRLKHFTLIEEGIRKQCLAALGLFDNAKAGVMVLGERFNYPKQKLIVKVNHIYVDKVKAALTLLTKIGRQRVIFRCVGVSGILRKAENKYVR
ncbi:MAG: Rpp14/Pop5 family protein [Candidatus Woesearchaeota archaeon]